MDHTLDRALRALHHRDRRRWCRCAHRGSGRSPQAEFNSKVTAHDGGELGPGKKFREWGTVSFGNGNVLKFDTVGAGEFGPVGDEGLMQGGIVWAVDGGSGLFENAKGIITSNFAVDAAGDVVDYHTGVIYLP